MHRGDNEIRAQTCPRLAGDDIGSATFRGLHEYVGLDQPPPRKLAKLKVRCAGGSGDVAEIANRLELPVGTIRLELNLL
jgi:hypothetical protein